MINWCCLPPVSGTSVFVFSLNTNALHFNFVQLCGESERLVFLNVLYRILLFMPVFNQGVTRLDANVCVRDAEVNNNEEIVNK